MSDQRFTPRTGETAHPASSRWILSLAIAAVVIFGLVFARFVFLAPHGGADASGVGGPYNSAAAFPTATSDFGQSTSGASGQPVAGTTPNAEVIVPGYPPPNVDTPYEQSLRNQLSNPNGKVIMVSLTGQYMKIYQNGKLLHWTYVTTGKAQLETPTGFWHVMYKLSPFTFEPLSTDPNNHLLFEYASKVQYAIAFAPNGYYLHDAWWRTVWGPGDTDTHWDPGRLEYTDGSHGCVNTPLEVMTFLWTWADVGTPVIVYQN